jgi:hypothetical protein
MSEVLITPEEEQQLFHIWDKEEIKSLMSRRTYYRTANLRERELQELWVTESSWQASASYANNIGFFVGLDAIRSHYVTDHQARRDARLAACKEKDTTGRWANVGPDHGSLYLATLNTPLIVIADDGKTAQFCGYECGRLADGNPDGTADDFFTFGLVLVDLVRQSDGSWKIWHLIQTHDISLPVGENTDHHPLRPDPATDPVAAGFGVPDIQRTVYDAFLGWENIYYDMPKPHATYEAIYGYGPEGNFGRRYYERKGVR